MYMIHIYSFILSLSLLLYVLWYNIVLLFNMILLGILTKSMPDKLFKSLSLGLGLKNDELKEAAGGDELVYLLKINYCPPCPHPDLALGVAPHADMCALTILVPNHVNGLRPSKMAIRMMSSTFLMPSSSILVAKLWY